MKCYSEKLAIRNAEYAAFSLIEVVAALAILALACSTVLVVINRSIASAADSILRINAFEVARENMERLLTSDAVAEMTEYGTSEKYPNIQWQTTVEAFYEPATSRMWLRGICSAEYTDSAGEPKKIELTDWLTDLTKEQFLQIIDEKTKQAVDQPIQTEDKAAEYAGVDVQIIKQWVEAGMHRTPEGYYIKTELDLYKSTNGKPTIEDRKIFEEALKKESQSPQETANTQQQTQQNQPNQQTKENSPAQSKRRPPSTKTFCGYTIKELSKMPLDQVWKILTNCNEI
jgi:type II secretory pathway pseudopilin PulG